MILAYLFLGVIATAQQPQPLAANVVGVVKGVVVGPSGKPVEDAVVHESCNDGLPWVGGSSEPQLQPMCRVISSWIRLFPARRF
jgi:hypothetical protein